MDHLQGEQANQRVGGGFSATFDLAEIEPLLTLIRRMGCDAELRVHGADGGTGHLLYAAGELASGSFDGLSGPPALERVLALSGGALQLEVVRRSTPSESGAPAESGASVPGPEPLPEEQPRSAAEGALSPEVQPVARGAVPLPVPGEHASQAHTPVFGSSLPSPAFAGVLRGSGLGPTASGRTRSADGASPLGRWLWALAPALAIAVWIAAEIVERLGRSVQPPAAPSAQPREAQSH